MTNVFQRSGILYALALLILASMAVLLVQPLTESLPKLHNPNQNILLFNPHGGSMSLSDEGIDFTGTWVSTGDGCRYDGYLNGEQLESLKTEDPCDPLNFVSWLASQKPKLDRILGDKTKQFLRSLDDWFHPMSK